jgi:hypothetical protein
MYTMVNHNTYIYNMMLLTSEKNFIIPRPIPTININSGIHFLYSKCGMFFFKFAVYITTWSNCFMVEFSVHCQLFIYYMNLFKNV